MATRTINPIAELSTEQAMMDIETRKCMMPSDSTYIIKNNKITVNLADCRAKRSRCMERSIGTGTVILIVHDGETARAFQCDAHQIVITWCRTCFDREVVM